ncbi:MAG: [FeFe] hydrogenase H-cluster maturation GTPase HydF [Firmicutes bacterium]|nr:[FeFe] hydrogenase H-cluster maturation GTPase HydF [Bacillota bacterium]
MSMNNTPSGERIHIGLYGRRNAGKSSLVNALTGQSLAIVSDVLGTTTDPVLKAMELLPLGPVVMIDTPGLDDEGELGELRIRKAYQMLNKTDIALLVIDGTFGMTAEDSAILERILAKKIPYIVVVNKSELLSSAQRSAIEAELAGRTFAFVSATEGSGIHELKELIGKQLPSEDDRVLVRDLLKPSDFVVLVVPIDKAAPKGRLILPQQMTIRDILEADAVSITVKENELANTLANIGKKPYMVITDSQAFAQVSKDTPEDIYLTSFSILMARYKGDLELVVGGARELDKLADGDRILIAEGCTHHRQCGDIGTQKLPNWILKHSGKDIKFDFVSGTEFPDDLSPYRLIVHCGACMLNEREMKYRQKCAVDAGVPITNYGTAIAYMNGIFERSLEIFAI